MKTTKITCDGCEKNITTSGNSEDWRVAVTNEFIQSCGGVVTDMAIYPILEKDLHFCSYQCLKKWAKTL